MSANLSVPSIFDPIFLDTEHVKIRPLSTVSWQKLAEDLLYENSFHALFWGIKTPEDMEKRYEDALTALNAKKGNSLVFLNPGENEVLGMTQFMNVEVANKMIEIGGTWINKKYQKTYVNTETKLALLQYAFETLKLHRVEFRIDSANTESQKAVQRLDFHFDGELHRRKINANSESRDYVFYSVTDLSWPKVKNHINTLLEKTKLPEYIWLQKAKHLLKTKKAEEAFSAVQTALAQFPESPDLNFLAGGICDAHRTEKEAVPFYLKALHLGIKGKDRQETFLGLASTYRSLGQYDESKHTFLRGISEFPDYRPFYVFLALTEFNLNNPESSIKLLLDQLTQTTCDHEIKIYQKALNFYSTRLNEVFE
jgi:RimJ/RimL family protein N-acetyltransferase